MDRHKIRYFKYKVLILSLLICMVLRGLHSRDRLNHLTTNLYYSVLLHVGSVSSFFNSISFLFMVYL